MVSDPEMGHTRSENDWKKEWFLGGPREITKISHNVGKKKHSWKTQLHKEQQLSRRKWKLNQEGTDTNPRKKVLLKRGSTEARREDRASCLNESGPRRPRQRNNTLAKTLWILWGITRLAGGKKKKRRRVRRGLTNKRSRSDASLSRGKPKKENAEGRRWACGDFR